MGEKTKKIVIPVDGSKNALISLDYITLLFGPDYDLDIELIHVWPLLPPVLTEEANKDKTIRQKLRSLEKKNEQLSERILEEAKEILLQNGFDEDRIQARYQKQESSIAQDICNFTHFQKTDAILLTRRGHTDLETFMFGGVSSKLVDSCGSIPVWIAGSDVRSRKVLIGIDNSDAAMKAVHHAGTMLSRTGAPVTLFHTIKNLGRYFPLEPSAESESVQDFWTKKAGEEITPYIQKATEILETEGVPRDLITVKVDKGSKSEADDILKEAQKDDYGTVVLGRHGRSMAKTFLFGNVTNKILHSVTRSTLWIV